MRMQDGFQALAPPGVGKDDGAHRGAVERAVGAGHGVAEGGADRRHRRAARGGQGVGDGVGVDHGDAARGEQVGNGALAAADAAGEPDHIASWRAFAEGGIGIGRNQLRQLLQQVRRRAAGSTRALAAAARGLSTRADLMPAC
jgi:hypothetical protein